MKLHFRGIQVPALGSPRDIVYRNYLLHETRVEAKKHQMLLLTTIGAPFITTDSARSSWDRQAKQAFEEYVSLMFGEEVTPNMREENEMMEFYMNKVKNSSPVLSGSSSKGNLVVSNLPEF